MEHVPDKQLNTKLLLLPTAGDHRAEPAGHQTLPRPPLAGGREGAAAVAAQGLLAVAAPRRQVVLATEKPAAAQPGHRSGFIPGGDSIGIVSKVWFELAQNLD